jgi:hypothetical protein
VGVSDLTATQKGARLMARLLMHGAVKASDEAKRLEVGPARIYQILNDLSALHEVPMANDRGWWYIQWLHETEYEVAQRLLRTVRAELDEVPTGTGWCRPLKRGDVVQIEKLLARMVEGKQVP